MHEHLLKEAEMSASSVNFFTQPRAAVPSGAENRPKEHRAPPLRTRPFAASWFAFLKGFPAIMNDPSINRMKPFCRAAALTLLASVLAGCGGGSPYRLETRDSTGAQTQQQTYEQLLWEKKRAQRAEGAQGDL